MGKTLQRVLLKNFLLRSLDFSIGNSLSPCKKTYASTHVFGNRKLTTWRERQESEGAGDKVPQEVFKAWGCLS